MGFISSASTITITAKLTPIGRQQLLTNTSNIITNFTLGDSDANYLCESPLDMGMVPDLAGELGTDQLFSNGLWSGVAVESPIIVNDLGATKKQIQVGSSEVVITPKPLGFTTITGTSITQLIVDRNDTTTDGNVNLFKSFGLPITQDDKNLYTTFTSPIGYLDTAIRNLNQDKILVLSIDKCMYGEILDGKTVNIELETTLGTQYNLYTTFEESLTPKSSLDSQISETLELGSRIGKNIAFIFSDEIQKPNADPSKSWSTGSDGIKNFTINNKETFNPISVPSTSTNMDLAIGVAYLDKGIIVITEPSIVNNYDPITATPVIKTNSVSNEIAQNITCIVERTEFSESSNNTWSEGDLIRVSEVALYDKFNNIIAFAKSNQQIIIGANQYMVLGVRILV